MPINLYDGRVHQAQSTSMYLQMRFDNLDVKTIEDSYQAFTRYCTITSKVPHIHRLLNPPPHHLGHLRLQHEEPMQIDEGE